ncbi:MAG: histidine phosphatase family protein [Hasllibacter sp.]
MGLTFLRHPVPDVPPGTCYGATDPGLAPGWRGAVDALALRPAAVRHSPLSRCRLPAERLAARLGVPAIPDPDLREMDFGAWEMRPWSAIPRAELDAWAADLTGYRPPGGETVAEMAARAGRALARAAPGEALLAHAGIWKALQAARGAPGAWEARIGFLEARPL